MRISRDGRKSLASRENKSFEKCHFYVELKNGYWRSTTAIQRAYEHPRFLNRFTYAFYSQR